MQKRAALDNESGPELAPGAGFEPATDRLTADCSTAELPRIKNLTSARHTGREGAVFWQSVPRHARTQKIPGSFKTRVSLTSMSWVTRLLAASALFHPATDLLTADCSTAELPRIKNLTSARHTGREGAVFWQSVPRHARTQKIP